MNENTQQLLETVALPTLAHQFKRARNHELNLVTILLQGQSLRTFHRPKDDAYSFRIWLDNPLWNVDQADALLAFLELVAERLQSDAAFRQRIAHELQMPPEYQTNALRPAADEEGHLFPMFSLAIQLQ